MMQLEKIETLVAAYSTQITEFLRDVIQIDSPSCREEQVVRRVAAEMESCGFDEVTIDQMGNVIGRMGNGPLKIMYDAHLDVVRVPDAPKWKYPPFSAALVDGIIYGRGATDEKPAISGMVYAARILRELKALDGFTLYVVGSVMEEDCDGYPLQHIIEQEKIKPDVVVLGEPTDLQVYRGHRGRMEMRIHTEGVSAHGAHVDKGVNAVYLMAPIITGIEQLNERLADDPFLGKGTVTVSGVEVDSASLCSVPDGCTIYLDRRLTVGETEQTA
ncbi:YgeY family selenium metabolism-linked hydrolase, partial [bacterium]|nr:YgeY family selenium metabolism-linked hydrolase [bacterium]